ncbi:hypothetical protein HNQ92_000626 [Rhabdobacter roseus]|uniref:Carboxypeptidase regulatory-like domain-containing protein n=1 Tax=Rhabdobacter roseus TaxID=1655419 RepID=A0A840THS8_9BACT|nr:hypothetical protein [Rhabdobacter roseus]MBB5282505.1 hypothetical protein [Rhabdobacter roseus]
MGPTILTGRVVDENDQPMAGIVIDFSGMRRSGFAPIPTFSETTQTDEKGNYTFSKEIPQSTTRASISLQEPQDYQTYFFIDGNYHLLSTTFTLPREDFGKTTTLHFQLRKC